MLVSKIARRAASSASKSTEGAGMAHFVFGANTDVGKTVITVGLIRACQGVGAGGAHYIKPLQCGGSDQDFVQRHAPEETITSATLFEWERPTSPHAASRLENHPVSDEEVISSLMRSMDELKSRTPRRPTWVETAGGVLSPSSSSPQNSSPEHAQNASGWGWMTQGDLYRDFREEIDVVMIGDGRLGGISATLSSLESLLARGYNVAGVVLIEKGYSNQDAIREYASRFCPRPFSSGASMFNDPSKSIISLPELPPEPEPLLEWYESMEVSEVLESFVQEHLSTTWNAKHS